MQPTESVLQALDNGVFRDLLESLDQPNAVAAVYRKFVENAAVFIRDLRQQDNAARAETFHTLKGSAAMLGAERMAEVAARLQAQAESSSLPVSRGIPSGLRFPSGANPPVTPGIEAGIDELERELAQFRAALAAQLRAAGCAPEC